MGELGFKGTPGPWRRNDGNEVIADRESHELLFMTPHNTCETCAINARLIAAAPELLEALMAAVGDFDAPCPHCQGKGKIPGSRNWVAQGFVEADCFHCGATGKRYNLDWFPKAQAAIAKALGHAAV